MSRSKIVIRDEKALGSLVKKVRKSQHVTQVEHSDDTPMAAPVGSAVPSRPPYPDNLNAAMRQHVKSVFDKYSHNLTATKTALGISVNTLKKYLA